MTAGDETFFAAVFGIPVARIRGPREQLERWAADPELYRGTPGLLLRPGSGGAAPFEVVFQTAGRNQVRFRRSGSVLLVQGDLAAFQREDFRRALVHLAKAAAALAGHHLVHAACVRGAGGPAALLCGAHGGGKSTTALLLSERGYPICATDLCLVNGNAEVVGGSRHINLYPEILKRYFPALAAQSAAGEGFGQKVTIEAGDWRFDAMREPVPVARVFLLSVRLRDSHPLCAEVPAMRRLRESPILFDDWISSDWLCPSWKAFLPPVGGARAWESMRRAALGFAGLRHYRVRGDPGFVARAIESEMAS